MDFDDTVDDQAETTAAAEVQQVGGGVLRRRSHKALFDATLKEIFFGKQIHLRDPIGAESHETVVYGGVYHGEEVAVKIFILVVDDLRDAIGAYGAFKVECEKTTILARAHPNVLPVIDYGELEVPPDIPAELKDFFPLRIVPFMITRRAPYGSLDRVVRQVHALPGFTRVKLMRAVCEATKGIKAAHDHQVAHRDIKPQNILIFGPEDGKIADFGIARWRSRMSTTNIAMLTPRYSSPEQAFHALTGDREEQVGISGDIYSWAIVVYELVTGRHPFTWSIKGLKDPARSKRSLLKAIARNDRRGFTPTGDITFDAMIHQCIADYRHRIVDIEVANRVLNQLVTRIQRA